jgi:hypothetical protein
MWAVVCRKGYILVESLRRDGAEEGSPMADGFVKTLCPTNEMSSVIPTMYQNDDSSLK